MPAESRTFEDLSVLKGESPAATPGYTQKLDARGRAYATGPDGVEVNARLPRLDNGGRDRTVGSMFLFGVSYAVASIDRSSSAWP